MSTNSAAFVLALCLPTFSGGEPKPLSRAPVEVVVRGVERTTGIGRFVQYVDAGDVALFASSTSPWTATLAAAFVGVSTLDFMRQPGADPRVAEQPYRPKPAKTASLPSGAESILLDESVFDVAYGPKGRELFLVRGTEKYRWELQRRDLESGKVATDERRGAFRWLEVSSRGVVALPRYRRLGGLLPGKLLYVQEVDGRTFEKLHNTSLLNDGYVQNPVCRFSADGKYLAAGAKILETDGWTTVFERKYWDTIQLAFHPTQPLCLVSVGSRWNRWEWSPPRVFVVDLTTDETSETDLSRRAVELVSPLRSEITALAWLPDGKGLVFGTHDGYLGLVREDVDEGTLLGPFGEHGGITSIRPSPSGRWVVFTGERDLSRDTPLFVYDRETERVLERGASVRNGFDMHPTEDRIVFAASVGEYPDVRGIVAEIDLAKLDREEETTSHVERPIGRLANGLRRVVGDIEWTDLRGDVVRRLGAFNPETLAVTGSRAFLVEALDSFECAHHQLPPNEPTIESRPLPPEAERLVAESELGFFDAAYSADGEQLYVVARKTAQSSKGWIEVLHAETGRSIERRNVRSLFPVRVAVSATGKLAVAGQRCPSCKYAFLLRRLEVQDVESKTIVGTVRPGESLGEGRELAFSKDGKHLVASTRIFGHELSTGGQNPKSSDGHRIYATRMSLDPHEPRVLLGWSPGNYLYGGETTVPALGVAELETVRLTPNPDVDLETARRIGREGTYYSALAWLPQHDAIVVGTSHGSLVVASTKPGGDRGPFHRLGHRGRGSVSRIAVSASGRWIAFRGRSLFLYDYTAERFFERPSPKQFQFHPTRDRLIIVEEVSREDGDPLSVLREIDLTRVDEQPRTSAAQFEGPPSKQDDEPPGRH